MYHSPRNPNDPNRTYNVRLVRFGPSPSGQVPYTPSSMTIQVTATSGLDARMAAQASYAGYTVVDVTERRY
jgi:hypothetical protein